MYRITRVVPKNNIYDLLSLDCVSKVEIKQGKNNFRNPKICRVDIYLTFLTNDNAFFKNSVTFLHTWGISNKNNYVIVTSAMALKDQFIKESSITKMPENLSIPKWYKEMSAKYTQEMLDNMFKIK